MAQAVVEVLAIARFGDQVTGGGVNIAQAHAGVDHRLGGFVGLAHQVMDGGILRLRLSAEECAGHIGAVAVLAAAHIDQHTLAFFQHSIVRLVVGVSGVCTKGYDGGKCHTLAAGFLVLVVNVLGNLLFGHAGLDVVARFQDGFIVDAGCFLHQHLFFGILHGAAGIHAVGSQHYRHTGAQLHQRDQELGRPFLVDAQSLGLVHHFGDLLHRLV